MDNFWNLNDLYVSFDHPQFTRDIEQLQRLIGDLKNWSDNNLNNYEEIKSKIVFFVDFENNYLKKYNLLFQFCSLSSSVDTTNKEAIHYREKLIKINSKHFELAVRFSHWIANIEDLPDLAARQEVIEDHLEYLLETQRLCAYLLPVEQETLLYHLKLTGSLAWQNLQKLLTSTLTGQIEINGELKYLPINEIQNYYLHPDKNLRKQAYYSELEAYSKIEHSVAGCINSIKGESIITSTLKGFKSPLEKVLIKSRMDQEILDALLNSINNNLDIFDDYFKFKASVLGGSEGLSWYDLFAPITEDSNVYTITQARDIIVSSLGQFSQPMKSFVQKAFDQSWIDFEIREGKVGGAFCSNVQSINQSRILVNFKGNVKNLITLAHELGHAYHGYCLANQTMLNSSYPMPLAETASIFNECLFAENTRTVLREQDILVIKESLISNAAQVIVDIYSRFLFESQLFDLRRQGPLSVEDLKKIMIDSQLKAYRNNLDKSTYHPYRWVNKPHYYRTDIDFYNFPYAFGLLFAKGLFSHYQNDKIKFISVYDELLSSTGKKSIDEVGNELNINFKSADFWDRCFNIIAGEIRDFLNLYENFK